MIFSDNRDPQLPAFRELMKKTDALLNQEALGRESYYAKRNGTDLEEDVYDALTRAAYRTPFEGSIQLVSGAAFPDIVANNYYGVEVKSTNKNHWRSIGSSILESTRIQSVERIFLTFGKLGAPVAFRSRPYEECLYGISVTHYPRYQIDMELRPGETIFDKMGVPYDTLRKMSNPVEPVSRYYKSQLQPGESLWWADTGNIEEDAAPPTVKLWTALSAEAKEELTVQAYVLFPEVLRAGSPIKYNRYALWLVTKQGVVNTNIRDSFSAGGKVDMRTVDGVEVRMPAAFGRIRKYHELIEDTLFDIEEESLKECWETDNIDGNRLRQWCRMVATSASTDPNIDYSLAWKVLLGIFPRLEEAPKRETVFVYNKSDGSKIRVEDVIGRDGIIRPKVVETPFASIKVGDSVIHKTFGRGQVAKIGGGLITVAFSHENKQFQYPQAFQNGFLKKTE